MTRLSAGTEVSMLEHQHPVSMPIRPLVMVTASANDRTVGVFSATRQCGQKPIHLFLDSDVVEAAIPEGRVLHLLDLEPRWMPVYLP